MAIRVVQWATGGVGRAAIEGIARHPDLSSGRGTVKLPTKRAADVTDAELSATLKAVLGG